MIRKGLFATALFALLLSGCGATKPEEKPGDENLNFDGFVSVFNARENSSYDNLLHGMKEDGSIEVVKRNNGDTLHLSSLYTSLVNINSKYFLLYDSSTCVVNKVTGKMYYFSDDCAPLGNGSYYTQKSFTFSSKDDQDTIYLICTNKLNTEWKLMKMSIKDELKLTQVSVAGDNLHNFRNFVVDKDGTAIYNAYDKENNIVLRCIDRKMNAHSLPSNNISDYAVAGDCIIYKDDFNNKTRFQKLSVVNDEIKYSLIGYATSYFSMSQNNFYSPYSSDEVLYNSGSGYYDFSSVDTSGYIQYKSISNLGMMSIGLTCVSKDKIYFYGNSLSESSPIIATYSNGTLNSVKTGIYDILSFVSSNNGTLTFIARLSGGGSVTGVYNGSFNVKGSAEITGQMIGM